ncbi:MAG: ATP phosphoribosyltransferase [Fusobacteriaceae bacterium]|nr:ATP phosphoribosyltransferase [Fusobacteriaceae bacterium]MBN2837886.1 ATP phosphoribosyltransferase [Fusobacteriaceae bacterium]
MEIRIALPKGRLGEKAYDILKKNGYECLELEGKSRKLVFFNEEKNISYFMVKPSDVPTYVERGAADIGIVGKDTLLEEEADVYELLDLGFGKCKFAIAAPNGFVEDESKPLIVATKYVNVCKNYYDKKDRKIDIVKLNGSVELGPLVNLSDVILDIVETGSTLKENNLSVIEDVADISARLIANKSSFKFKRNKIENIVEAIKKEIGV